MCRSSKIVDNGASRAFFGVFMAMKLSMTIAKCTYVCALLSDVLWWARVWVATGCPGNWPVAGVNFHPVHRGFSPRQLGPGTGVKNPGNWPVAGVFW